MQSCNHSNFSQFSTKINQLDLEQPRNEYLFNLPTVVSKWIITNLLKGKEENNIFILLVTVNILLTSLPLAIGLYVLENRINNLFVVIFGTGYFLFHLLIYARSFILALHYSTHTPIFQKKWRFLKYINNLFLCNFFGIPPGLYYSHHIAMHHSHNNTT